MKQEEIEKQAEEYVIKTVCKTECPVWNIHSGCTIPRKDCHYTSNRLKGYIDGAKWGMEHAIEWHDLRKNPNDLPKEDCTEVMFITKGAKETLTGTYKNGGGEGTPIFDTFGIAFYDIEQVIAWCELPQFKE